MTSYYDSVGLLAICDAIESVEGIPLSSLPSPFEISKSARSAPKDTAQIDHSAPPNSNSQTPNADPGSANDNEAHVPSDLVAPPYPYPPFISSRERRTSATNTKTRKLSLPLIPYNHVEASGPESKRSYPMIYAQSLQYQHQDAARKGDDSSAAAAEGVPYSFLSAQLSATTPSKQYAVNKAADAFAQKKREQQRSRKLSSSLAELPAMMLDNKMSHMSINSKPVAVPSPIPIPENGRPPVMIGGFKVEECHICGRNFKGPKASTHKQQHIRRLHPEDYTPKRGGKKRVVIDPPTIPMSQSSPY